MESSVTRTSEGRLGDFSGLNQEEFTATGDRALPGRSWQRYETVLLEEGPVWQEVYTREREEVRHDSDQGGWNVD